MICSILTEGLSLDAASELTGQNIKTLSWVRQKIRNGSFSDSKEIGQPLNQVPQEKKNGFRAGSGSLNERRIPFST